MLNLLTARQSHEADLFTIQKSGEPSLALMERAAKAFTACFLMKFPDTFMGVCIFCGTGNNGGDGLAIARLLKERGYTRVEVRIAAFNEKRSADFDENDRLARNAGLTLLPVNEAEPVPAGTMVIIDALLGSGLNKPLNGRWQALVNQINDSGVPVVAVDVPTGFLTEGVLFDHSPLLKCQLAITFQRPKINFFLPESAAALDAFNVVDIGLDEEFIQAQHSGYRLVEERDVSHLLSPRKAFSHKGTFGHALIVAGAPETMGAALLCARACLYTGAGLTTACIPDAGTVTFNTAAPEVMLLPRPQNGHFSSGLSPYQSTVIGPGLGVSAAAADLLKSVIELAPLKLVIDADALNILAQHPQWLNRLPAGTIITPHLKEFDRIFGAHTSWWARLETAKARADQLNIVIVLKNRYTFIVCPGQEVAINPTGSPAMATGGMGDVLAGMIGAFLAQGYTAEQAAVLGVYVHGYCGQTDQWVLPASELITLIPKKLSRFIPA